MKAVRVLLILLLFGSLSNAAKAQTDIEYVRNVWPELLELYPDPWAAPIQWFVHNHTAIGNVCKKDIAEARKRLRMIQAEAMAHPEIEWAGIYTLYASEIGHLIFAFAPQSGYVAFETVGCGGAIQNVAFGKVDFQRDRLKIMPDYGDPPPPNDKYIHSNLVIRRIKSDTIFIPVKWASAYFLVEEKQIAEFCRDFIVGRLNYTASQIPFSRPLMKFYGTVKDDALAPILPPKYSHLAKRPIIATATKRGRPIIRRDKEGNKYWHQVHTFVINKGAIHGIKTGMGFITLGRDTKEKIYLEVVQVGKTFAIGEHTLSIPSEIKNSKKELKSYLDENAFSLSGKKMRSYSLWYSIEGI